MVVYSRNVIASEEPRRSRCIVPPPPRQDRKELTVKKFSNNEVDAKRTPVAKKKDQNRQQLRAVKYSTAG